MRVTKTFLLFLLISFGLNAQSLQSLDKTITLTGTVLDSETNDPLEYATLVLQQVSDPSKVTGGITDAQGKFSVEAKPGNYNVRIEYIGYKSYVLNNQQLLDNRDFGTIKLGINAEQLESVEVVAEKTSVEVRLDKKVYNIGKDLTTSGGTVTDALNNIPSVNVDVEGAISLRGNDNVRILINGKPSALAGYGSTDVLRQLPADAIEKVEVITSPSARYDAEGTAGILNIVLKKEKTLGFNGSVNANVSHPWGTQLSTNLNFRTKKFNLFTTLGYFYNEPPGTMHTDNNYFSGEFSRITEDRDINRNNNGFNANIGMEYYLTDKSSLTGSFFTRFADEKEDTDNNTVRYKGVDVDSRTLRTEDEGEDDQRYQYSLNYTNNLDDNGQKLTADLQYSYDNEDTDTYIRENTTYPSPNLLAAENIDEGQIQNNYLAQADYVLPMGDAQFEAGYRGTFNEDASTYALDSLNQSTGQYETNHELNNKFTYNENVNAFYSQYGNKFGQFSFLLGLRLENTQLKGKLDTEIDPEDLSDLFGVDVDANFNKNYLGLFPTLNFTWEIKENENITLGYNRRINRPRGWFINPFPSRSSRTNIFQGNPDLDPAYANAYDLGYLKRWKKLTLTSSIYFQKETNSFEIARDETGETTSDGINIIQSTPINLSTNKRYGAEMGLMYSPQRWLRLNGSFNYFQFNTEGSFEGVDYGAKNNSWFARFSSKVTLPAKIEWQTNAFYRGARQSAITETDPMFSINMAASKDILKDKATLTFNVSDLLNSRKRQAYTVTDSFESYEEFQWRKRQFTLSFIYRFNQTKENNRKQQGGRGNGDDMEEGGGEGQF